MIYCEQCEKEITEVEVLEFFNDGRDYWTTYPLSEHINGAFVDVDLTWCGEGLDESEIRDCIRCPHCLKYPFKSNEIQTFKYERVVMFKERVAEQKKNPCCGSGGMFVQSLGPLKEFFQKHLKDEYVDPLIDAAGVPTSVERKKEFIAAALAEQVKAFVESKDEDVDLILAEAYERQRVSEIQSGYQIPQVLYAGDNVWVEPGGNKHAVGCYEEIHHEWVIHNYGKAIWTKRKLVLVNQPEIRPKFSVTELSLPDVMPGEITKIAVDISANGFEGSFDCKWEMQDSEGKNCFPNSRYVFDINVTVSFDYDRFKNGRTVS